MPAEAQHGCGLVAGLVSGGYLTLMAVITIRCRLQIVGSFPSGSRMFLFHYAFTRVLNVNSYTITCEGATKESYRARL